MFDNEKEIFAELNRRLNEIDVDFMVIVAGGFVLSHYGIRTTHDIDGFFKTDQKINNVIQEVGEQFGINTEDELWLNNSVYNLNEAPTEEICEILYDFSNLKVLMPPLEYIAGMKLKSAREQDIQDVSEIIILKEISSPKELKKQLEKYDFGQIDESIILEAFGEAYGMEWLEQYYINNEEELLSI